MVIVNENVSFYDYATEIRLPDGWKFTINRKKTMTSQFTDMTSSSGIFDLAVFLLSGLVTGSILMLIYWLVLELWQFLSIKDWPEIWRSEITPSEFVHVWRLGQVRKTKFDTNISNKKYTLCCKVPELQLLPFPHRLRLMVHFLSCPVIFFNKILKYKLSFGINLLVLRNSFVQHQYHITVVIHIFWCEP